MSHSGRRFRNTGSRISNKIPERVNVPIIDELNQSGKLEADVIEGKFQGNGLDVLVGLSNVKDFDNTSVFLTNQKGIAVGYLEGSTNFCAFSNSGSAATATVISFPILKDRALHDFSITRYSDKVECVIDGQKVTLTTNIPSFSEVLKVITYGLY
jgi:hypothetical protein